jgi:hypothetical protein
MLEQVIGHQVARWGDFANMVATLLLRPTESVIVDVEYKQLTEEKAQDAR